MWDMGEGASGWEQLQLPLRSQVPPFPARKWSPQIHSKCGHIGGQGRRGREPWCQNTMLFLRVLGGAKQKQSWMGFACAPHQKRIKLKKMGLLVHSCTFAFTDMFFLPDALCYSDMSIVKWGALRAHRSTTALQCFSMVSYCLCFTGYNQQVTAAFRCKSMGLFFR